MAVGETPVVEGGAVPFKPVHTPATWTATEALQRKEEWTYALSPEDVAEIIAATKRAVATGKEIPNLTKEDFPLPTLLPKLENIRNNLLFGIGFQLVKGFPVDQLDRKEVATAYYGLGLNLGTLLPQNAKGHVLGHVKNLGDKYKVGADDVRVYQTNAAQPWHKDAGDIVGLLCLKTAKSGGTFLWAPSETIYNRLLETRPDLVKALTEKFPFDRKGEVLPGEKPYWVFSILTWYKGYLSLSPNERHVYEAERFPDAPRITELQKEAMAAVTRLANDPELHLEYRLEPGEINFLHNHNHLHSRTAFEDEEGFENRRHLLRLWVNHPDARPADTSRHVSYSKGFFADSLKRTAPLDAE